MLQQHYKQQREIFDDIMAALVTRHWQKMEEKKADSIVLLNYASLSSPLLAPFFYDYVDITTKDIGKTSAAC